MFEKVARGVDGTQTSGDERRRRAATRRRREPCKSHARARARVVSACAEDGAVTGIGFAGDEPATQDVGFDHIADQLREYFAGERTAFDLDMRPAGSAFERRVWDELLRIPYC